MGDETSNIEFADLLRSPGPPSQQTCPPANQDSERTLDEILAQSSTDLIRAFASSIKQGAVREASKTEEFQQEFKRRLYRAMIRMFVWSNARISHETRSGEGRLAEGVQNLLLLEQDQGRSSPPPPRTTTITGRPGAFDTNVSADMSEKIDFVRDFLS